MTIVAVQCRLSSTRLPGKALLPLGGKTVLDWTLASMKKVKADDYYVATDKDSADKLRPVCERNGFKVFVGPLDDVLERYCLLIEHSKADAVIRATADNPFLFYEAANALVEQYNRRSETGKCDYITFENLPHGSGVEMFNAKSLLEARSKTTEAYDHEHVGPSLYNHPENFTSVMIPSPSEWSFPNLRTTIDTKADYRHALAIVRKISGNSLVEEPYTSGQVLEALKDQSVTSPVLCVPCVKKGRGTGHLRRCLSIAVEIGADVYIPENADLEKIPELLAEAKKNGFEEWQIVKTLPSKGDYSLIITDAYTLERGLAQNLTKVAPLVSIDEGSLNTDLCDCLFDIIPSYGISRPSNVVDPGFVTLPANRRTLPPPKNAGEVKSILISVGGEDPADLVVPSVIAFAEVSSAKISAIVNNPEEAKLRVPERLHEKIRFLRPIHNLREKLFEYDVVVTHYGFTAFEALAAGCGVVLLGTTQLHVQLAQKYGFANLAKDSISSNNALAVLENFASLYPDSPFAKKDAPKKNLGEFVKRLARGRRFNCPICGEDHPTYEDLIVARTPLHTFRRCKSCGMLYMSWTFDSDDTDYNEAYFFDDYKKQYGKTYLDDFKEIKSQCVRRTSVVDQIYRGSNRKKITPTVLDIGCAFGPYLDAANDAGWQVYGTDASKEAVDYVQNTLHYPAVCGKFPAFDSNAEFGVKRFDAITMWYVIEHFQNLDKVLRAVSKILKIGGVFAFSTPSAAGVSGKFNTQGFFQNSPADHYTLWEPSKAASILKRYGFKVRKIVSTGHHPERFPSLKDKKKGGFKWAFYSTISKIFHLGDTFEVYCTKEKDIFQ